MSRGKEICKTLKEIRRRIAEENDIELEIPECTFKGECRGTCPKCEAELRYLDSQLRSRRHAGRSVKIAGIAAGTLALLSPFMLSANEPNTSTEPDTSPKLNIIDSVEVLSGEVPYGQRFIANKEPEFTIKVSPVEVRTFHGEVFDKIFTDDKEVLSEPIAGAYILNTRTNQSATSDLAGKFEIEVQHGDVLKIMFVGFETKQVAINDFNVKRFFLLPGKEVIGQVVSLTDDYIIKKVMVQVKNEGVDLKIQNKKGEIVSPERYAVSV